MVKTITTSEPKAKDIKTTPQNETSVGVAKAGKRSLKAVKEKEAFIEKEKRKKVASTKETDSKLKVVTKPRSKLERRSKRYQQVYKKIDHTKLYPLKEALKLAQETSSTKFDASLELHFNLNVDPRHANHNIRDSLVLPAGSGKQVKVAVYIDESETIKNKEINADQIAGLELLQKLDKGIIDFDILITTPNMMPKLAKYAKILGPKGLMPNPKSGTVTNDLAKASQEAKAGKVEYRTDSNGIIHIGIGKASFSPENLLKNAETLIASIKTNKPSSIKGSYIKSVYIASTMGPSVRVDHSIL